MAQSQKEFDRLVEQVRAREVTTIDQREQWLDDDDAIKLAEALKENTLVTHIDLWCGKIGDEGAVALAGALRGHRKLTALNLGVNKIGDEGIGALAEVLKGNIGITHIDLAAHIGDEGMSALAEVLESNPGLVHLDLGLGTAVSHESHAEFVKLVLENKNLISFPWGNDEIIKHTEHNWQKAQQLIDKLPAFEACNPQDWFQMAERLPVIRYLCSHSPQQTVAFEKFLSELPTVDTSQPTATKALTVKQGDYAAIDNPRTILEFPDTLSQLNKSGLYLRADALLDNGEPNALFQTLMDSGNVHKLFTADNWIGASRTELYAVLNAMPCEMKERVPNRHQLAAAISKPQQQQDNSLAR